MASYSQIADEISNIKRGRVLSRHFHRSSFGMHTELLVEDFGSLAVVSKTILQLTSIFRSIYRGLFCQHLLKAAYVYCMAQLA